MKHFIAVVVGLVDVAFILVAIVLFLRAKGDAKCLDAYFIVRKRARAVSLSAERRITALFDHMEEVVRARRQTRIRRNTVDVDDGSVRHCANPLQEIEMAQVANVAEAATKSSVDIPVL